MLMRFYIKPFYIMRDFPIPENEGERLKALHDYQILNSLSESEFDRITEIASIICDVPISLISFLDKDRQWFKSKIGIDISETSRDISFCQYAIMGSSPLEVEDATTDDRFKDNEAVTGDSHIRFYAGYPLIDPQGFALGTLSVIDRKPKILNPKQKRVLQLLADEVINLIVERRQKEELKNFQKTFELSLDLVCIAGTDGFFKKVNPTFKKLPGFNQHFLLNTSFLEMVHPEDRIITSEIVQRLSEGYHTVDFVNRTNQYKYIQWAASPETGTGNTFAIGRDVTDQDLLETELRRTREMLEQTNAAARVGGWEFDVVNQKMYWSSITIEIHGVAEDYEPDLTSGINFYKEGYSRDKITAALNDCINNGKSWDLELQISNANGRELWVRVLGKAEYENGILERLYGSFLDIDDYKQTEIALQKSFESQESLNKILIEQIDVIIQQDQTIEKIKEFKFLADSIPQIIWTSKPDGNLDYYNQHWFDYTGMTLEQTLSWGWETVLHPDDVENCVKTWTESFTTGKPYEVEYRFKRASDGVYKWHLGRALPMRNEFGEIVKWFGSCTDIDEYKRALDLENKISQYEDFNRIIAHNLRGPAVSIDMLLGMLSDATSEIEKDEFMDMLKASCISLNDTLNELMKVLELRNNKNLTYDDCNLVEMVSSVESMLKGQFVSKKVEVITRFEAIEVKFPKIYLESIFYNMISNAIKYSKADTPPKIEIASTFNNDNVILTFKDNGLGIDLVKHGANMFKLNKVFHSGYDSKGVGLFMTKTQIETFGGKITVESEPNVGSKFTIKLKKEIPN